MTWLHEPRLEQKLNIAGDLDIGCAGAVSWCAAASGYGERRFSRRILRQSRGHCSRRKYKDRLLLLYSEHGRLPAAYRLMFSQKRGKLWRKGSDL